MLKKTGCLRKALNITALSHDMQGSINVVMPWMAKSATCDRRIPFVLNITALSHPCDRRIPFVLNIKKPA
jgi:hypothetical protein